MPTERRCEKCGAVLVPFGTETLCPNCMLHEAIGLAADPAAQPAAASPVEQPGTVVATAVTEKPGDRIGRYKLLQQIGEGGMGVVYMAEQEEPIRRRVALKVIKLGMDTKSVIARFEAERQALALMENPNIAKIFDAGATESGRPFFVMELVNGIPITQFCDEQRLPTSDRLGLFVEVCSAIQHAHQKGVIHRDIKPSNILVTLHGDKPVPKVIDFGVAKASQQRLTDKTLFTRFLEFIGTPAYISPEQASLSGLDIDTRSDIYSLGVLLYELLTGTTPFDAKALVSAGLDEMRRKIREEEPPKPSTRLTQELMATGVRRLKTSETGKSPSEEEIKASSRRRLQLKELIGLLRGDLDWIVMKALEKDRGRRYETVNGLARDIQRHLNSEPVIARPPSNRYRFQKMVRRNKLAFAAVAAVAAALVIGLTVSTWQFVEKRKALQRAVAAERDQSRLRAEAENRQANEAQLRKQAEATGIRLSETLEQLELQRAEDLFSTGDSSTALAYLARVLRQNPTNRVAAERVLSALTHRNFALPSIDPVKHEAPVYSASFSPDGQRVVTVSADKSARIWDAKTGRLVTEPLKHESDVVLAQFSPDGHQVVTACGTETWGDGPSYARLWDANSGQPLSDSLTHRALVSSAQFSPDGQRLVTASFDGTARVWEAKTGQPLTGSLKHGDELTSVQFSPDGQRLVTASKDGTARIWNARTGEPIAQPLKHTAPIVSVDFNPDGQRVVTASANQFTLGGATGWRRLLRTPTVWDARVWDASTGQPLTQTQPLQHFDGVLSARFSPDGLRVVTASQDKTARLWDAKTGQPLTEPLRHQAEVVSAQFSPDGRRVVTASSDKTALVWDAQTGRPLTEPLRHGSEVRSAQFSPDGQRVVTASLDRTARIWDTRIRQTLIEPLKHESLVSSAQFDPDGRYVVTASLDGMARIWDARTGRQLIEPLKPDGGISFADFSPDGRRVVTASRKSARVWEVKTGRPVTDAFKHEKLDYAQFSPDGQRVVTASQDNTARVWDAQTGQPLTDLLKHEGVVWSARFSRDGLRVVTASMDKTARIWDANTGQPLTEPLKHEDSVLSAEFSSDGRRVLTASGDKTARVWDANTGRPLTARLNHEDLVYSAQFSPDGRRVVTASQDKTARVWDAETGQQLTVPLQHLAGVRSAQFSLNGQRIVTASFDKTARVWDAKTGQPLTELLAHEAPVALAHFSPDGQRVLTASWETARVWDVPTAYLPVPDWLPKLTEAIVEKRFDDQGISQPVPFAELQALKGEVGQSSASDAWTRWAKWFFADPATRTISPFSVITVREYIERRIEESSQESLQAPMKSAFAADVQRRIKQRALESLQEAVKLDPTNGLALARLASAILAQESGQNPNQLGEAEWLTHRAVEFAPGVAEVWRARAEALERIGNLSEALVAIKAASKIQPQNSKLREEEARILEKSKRNN